MSEGERGTLEPTVTSMHGAKEYQQNDVCTEEGPPREELTCVATGGFSLVRTGQTGAEWSHRCSSQLRYNHVCLDAHTSPLRTERPAWIG